MTFRQSLNRTRQESKVAEIIVEKIVETEGEKDE
jgi:hypothetical protein